MNYNKNEIMEIVREILGDNATGVYINDCVVSRDISISDAPIYSTLGSTPFEIIQTPKFDIKWGFTRVCIIPHKKTDWVIKIPMTHIYTESWSDDEEDYGNYDSESFLGYKCVGKVIEDMCDEEIAIYENADTNERRVLAEIKYVGEYHGIPIYVQERIKRNENDAKEKDIKYGYTNGAALSNEIDALNQLTWDYSDVFYHNLILSYGFKMAYGIVRFLSNNVEDIHEYNYGYDYNGLSKVFDFAGYNRYIYHFYKDNEREEIA